MNYTGEGILQNEENKSMKEQLNEQLQNGIRRIMETEEFKNWLNTGSKILYNNYSFNNAMLIWLQKPEATYCMSYDAWKDFGRNVKEGAKGAKIFKPVMAYEKKYNSLFRMIKNNLIEQLKNNKELEQATYRLGMSKLEFTMNRNGLIGLKINGKEKGIFENDNQLKKFIQMSILNKVPMYYTVGTVFDKNDVMIPEYLWVKKGFKKEEIVRDKDGKAIKNSEGEYKIYNTPERQEKFKENLDTKIASKDPKKMAILKDVLIEISKKNGIPIYLSNEEEDDTLKTAKGYFARVFNDKTPKGFIVINKDLEVTEKCSVLLHEMAHSDMHGSLEKLKIEMGEKEITKSMREIQAEAVAYMTASNFGIETDTSSFQYLAAYQKGFELEELQKSMDVIYKETQKLVLEIKNELEERGLNLDLSIKEKEVLSEEKVNKFSKEYLEEALKEERNLIDIKEEIPRLIKENIQYEQIIDLLKEQNKNVESRENYINAIKNEVNKLNKCKDRRSQDVCLEVLGAVKELLEDRKEQFNNLTEDFIELCRDRNNNLREEFEKSPNKTIEKMKLNYKELADISLPQQGYICMSKYIADNYSQLLRNKPDMFVKEVCNRANHLNDVISKNNTFVEINFCEQWTEEAIFKDGTLCHPKVANDIVKQAEQQIRMLKEKAKEKGEYFPYVKCNLSVYSIVKEKLMVLKTAIDIGDGEQNTLKEHIEKVCRGEQTFLENFEKAIKERGSKEKIYIPTALLEVEKAVEETVEESRVDTVDNWKKNINTEKENNINTENQNKENKEWEKE